MDNTKNIPWKAIIAQLRGSADQSERDTLSQWLSCSDNARLYSELESLWGSVQQRASQVDTDKEQLWLELRHKIKLSEPGRRVSLRRMERFGRWAACAVAASLLIVLLLRVVPYGGESERVAQDYSVTNLSGKSRISMSDGSAVWLHDNTTLSYDTRYGGDSRRVLLDGEAYFDVAHNEQCSFTVVADQMEVTVYGTKFNVASYKNSQQIRVGLVEGSVSVSADGVTKRVRPGEIALYDKATKHLTIAAGDIDYESLWVRDNLRITNKPLGEICRYLSRWYNCPVELDSTIAYTYYYSFTITEEPLEEVLRIMNRINPIKYEFREDGSVAISSTSK